MTDKPTPGQAAYEAWQAVRWPHKSNQMPWDHPDVDNAAFDAAAQAAIDVSGLAAERDKLGGACQLLGRVVEDQGRAMYAAWIDAVRGDHAAATETITQQVEQVLELHTWNGTETGMEWFRRTQGEDRP